MRPPSAFPPPHPHRTEPGTRTWKLPTGVAHRATAGAESPVLSAAPFRLLPLLLVLAACSPSDLDDARPTVTITSPEDGAVLELGDTVLLSADAADADGSVAVIRFFVDGRLVGQDASSPFEAAWDTKGEDGWEHTLQAQAVDDRGLEAAHSVTVYTSWVPHLPESVGDGWEAATLQEVGLDPEPLTTLVNLLRRGEYPEVHSVVAVRHGKLVLEEYFPGHDFSYSRPGFLGDYVEFGRDTRHNTHSATKSVISALVGLARDQGLIESEDQAVFPFFPEYAQYAVGGKEAITIRDMLTMRSGLEWHEWDAPVSSSSVDAFNRSTDPLGYVLSQPLLHTPGTVFNYSGGTVNVLCQLVARAAGVTVDHFAHQHLFQPLGVGNYAFPQHFTGIPVCHGDIYITPRDMAKFGYLYLEGGTWQGARILSEDWIQRSIAPSVSVRNFGLGWATDYGYLWWLRQYSVGGKTFPTFKALGWGGQEIWVVPQEDLVVVFTGANYTVDPPCDELMARYILPAILD